MKLNWLVRCVLYFIISMLINPFYDGWSSTAKYLISEGVYSNKCEENIELNKLYHLKPVCDEQAYQVGRLLSFYRTSEFLSSIFIGVFMDNFGPKFTILIAILLRILSWLMIPSYPNTTWVIIFSCILTGVTSNGVAFPVFTIAQYTKKFYNASMAAISVSLCFGTFYTFILNHIKYGLSDYSPIKIILVKLAITHLPLLLMSAFIFPRSLERDVILNTTGVEPPPKLEKPTTSDQKKQSKRRWKFMEFLTILKRADIVVISVASMVNVVSLTFSQEAFPIAYGDNKLALTVNEVLIPLSFVFSVSSVYFLERFGSVPIIVILNVVGAVVHFTMFFTNTLVSVFTSIMMSMSYSLFMTQYYLYLDKQVPLAYQGSIKGFLVTSIGFLLFVNFGLNHLSKAHGMARRIHITIFVLRLLVTAPLLRFLRFSRRRSISLDNPV